MIAHNNNSNNILQYNDIDNVYDNVYVNDNNDNDTMGFLKRLTAAPFVLDSSSAFFLKIIYLRRRRRRRRI